eukprot:CAMPEP_0202030074 /NCGR_PEP_ID=MMETSP0905-20130828/64308_1 /ASSEMBLY_ACC=CAM_ASM_000554 /TAXON_ID=420261 /ORGANISM="Thalassiosira antarctica, Strain CCMP982" /LENGTH=539 /DNA_ID=CAMNT_0048593861 /DNA_START=353 /DNA_END=1972 /DNA_ORIENTATION=-
MPLADSSADSFVWASFCRAVFGRNSALNPMQRTHRSFPDLGRTSFMTANDDLWHVGSTMPIADTPFLGLFAAPFYTTDSNFCTMPLADSSADSFVWASFCRAVFGRNSALNPMQRTHRSFPDLGRTSFMTANDDLWHVGSTMPIADTPFLGLFAAPFYTTDSNFCTMPLADSSADSFVWASFCRAVFGRNSALNPMQRTHRSFPDLGRTSFMTANDDLWHVGSTMPIADTPFLGLFAAPFYTTDSNFCTMPLADSSADSFVWASFCRAVFGRNSALNPMQRTHCSFPGLGRTSFMTANDDHCPMTQTRPSSDCPFCASLVTACSALRLMTPTNSFTNCLLGASFITAKRGFLRSMPPTHSSVDDLIGASFDLANFDPKRGFLRSMPPTHSSVDDLIGASFDLANFDLCSVPLTHSSINYMLGASFMTAHIFCSMPPTNSFFDDLVGASFDFASSDSDLCSVPYTNSSFDDLVGTSFMITNVDLRSMTPTKSSLLDSFGASFMNAKSYGIRSMLCAKSSSLGLIGASFECATTSDFCSMR